MLVRAHRVGAAIAVLALGLGTPASAQENFDQGKTPAQLYASDCAICHKSAQGLSRAGGIYGLTNFLREHYTASREAAAAIAGYLQQADREPPPTGSRNTRRSHSKPKLPPERPTAGKATDTKPADAKPAEAKPAGAKPAGAKPADEGEKAQAKDTKPANLPKDGEPGQKAD
jgi:hypothetical protein